MAALKTALAAVIKKYRGHPEFLGLEISDPNQPGAVDDTLLHLTARLGALDDMRVLLAAGADVNAVGDLGNTPLHGAAMRGQTEAVRYLLELGADALIKNEFGETAANVAALGNHKAVVEILEGRNLR